MTFHRDLLPNPADYFAGQGIDITWKRGDWASGPCLDHGGSESRRYNKRTGASVCMNCGARSGDVLGFHMALHGLEFVEAARQLGAWTDDGAVPPKPAAFSPRAAIEVLRDEAMLAGVALGNMGHGVAFSEADRQRFLTGAARIVTILEEFAP